ncbi:protein JINGUBANG-like isoform X1 [Juglans microcarpa x Juglans regia]|uniref:protein JINGUBANG-like isoform X1 n=1 Tax=Juglans microcarpa x Juglans regia TaxID=2249226 RepID=UPI001B7DC40E|nr:protein JINGUBANG-like isoform X1 [Juglans microcarpa x Juglans regia]
MSSLESPNSPPNLSFTIRPGAAASTPTKFSRSISTKEPSFSHFPYTPPRLSAPTTLSKSLHTSPLASPLHSPVPTKIPDLHSAAYQCVSSVLKKDGQILSIAVSNGFVYTGSDANAIRIWRLPEFAECGQLKTKACMVVALVVSNERVYAAYGDGKIRVWRRTSDHGGLKHIRLATIPKTGSYVRSYIAGKDKTQMKHTGPITALAISASDDILYSASLDKTVKVWRISDLKCIETIQAHPEPINAIAVADDGVLFTASDDATVKVWRRNFCRGDQPHSLTVTLPAKSSPVKSLALTQDGGVLYGGCTDGYINYWLMGWFSGQLNYGGALQGHTHAVMCLASVASYVVSGSADATCRVWIREQDGGQHTCVAVLVGHRGPIRSITAFSGALGEDQSSTEDGFTICTGSLDGVLKVWHVTCKNVKSSSLQSPARSGSEYFEL